MTLLQFNDFLTPNDSPPCHTKIPVFLVTKCNKSVNPPSNENPPMTYECLVLDYLGSLHSMTYFTKSKLLVQSGGLNLTLYESEETCVLNQQILLIEYYTYKSSAYKCSLITSTVNV